MSISQSRANSRGVLIAVIKIEIQEGQVDRIFLHQNDDDYRLAEEFQQKHRLSPMIVGHIHNKIRASRESVQQGATARSHLNNTLDREAAYTQKVQATPYSRDRSESTLARNYAQNESLHTPYKAIDTFMPVYEQQQDQFIPDNEAGKPQGYPGYAAQTSLEDYPRKQMRFEQPSKRTIQQVSSTNNQNWSKPSGREKIGQSRDLFEGYFQQTQQSRDSGSAAKPYQCGKVLIEIKKANSKRPPAANTRSLSKLHNRKNVEANHSFNEEDKPSRVKILRKQQIDQLNWSKKKSISNTEKERIANQVTSRLYNQNELKKNYLSRLKERAKQKPDEEEDKQLTLRPNINKVSKLLVADRYKNQSVEDYLLEQARVSMLKKQMERASRQQKELKECSFKPQVNTISKRLVPNPSQSNINSVYLKDKSKCTERHSSSQANFRPSINQMSQKIVAAKGQLDFDERMKWFLENKNTKLNELARQKSIKQKYDEQGRRLYQPQIYSKPSNRELNGQNIHQHLHEMSKMDKTTPAPDQKPTINENSEQIMQQMQSKRIAWIFSELDSDQDGLISSKKVAIDTLKQEVLQIISPVLFEMEEYQTELNLNEFRNSIKKLHLTLNAYEKSILYNYCYKNPQNIH